MGAAHPGAEKPPLYFVNAPIDCALIGGASILAYVLLSVVGGDGGRGQLPAVAAVLAPLCNWPHFAASSYRLYHARENVRQYPVTALVVPFVVGAGMVWAFAAPDTIAPFYVKLVLLWSPYHFSGQSLGMSLVYARRAGFSVGRAERLSLAGFIFTAFLAVTAHAETGSGMRHYLGVDHPKLGLPPWVADDLELALWGFGAVFLLLVLRWCVRERRMLPPVVCLPAATQCLWFVLGRHDERFQLLVPFFHSLQYLFVAWAVQLKEKMASTGAAPSPRFVALETTRWWTGNVILGLALFLGFPQLCALAGYGLGFAMAITSSAVQLHHFFVDGVIWKLKNPRVRSPLLVNLDELLRPAPVELAA